MTPPQPILHIRRDELVKALRLPANDLRVLVALLVRACSSTGRVWEPPERLAESLGLSTSLVEDTLHHLASHDFLEQHPTLMRQLRSVELGEIFVRPGSAPDNLPFEPTAV